MSRPYFRNAPEIHAVHRAIGRCGRPMLLSLSPGETPLAAAADVALNAICGESAMISGTPGRCCSSSSTGSRTGVVTHGQEIGQMPTCCHRGTRIGPPEDAFHGRRTGDFADTVVDRTVASDHGRGSTQTR